METEFTFTVVIVL